jgi:hypothetical protein
MRLEVSFVLAGGMGLKLSFGFAPWLRADLLGRDQFVQREHARSNRVMAVALLEFAERGGVETS